MKIGIAHCAFDLGRRERLRRLLGQLGTTGEVPWGADVSSSTCSEPANLWATRLWRWAAAQDDDVLLLNDDVDVCPDIVAVADAALRGSDAEILSLHTVLPEAADHLGNGKRYLRSYLVSGPGYVLRRGVAARLLRFAARVDFEHLKEDNVLSYFAFHEQQPSWHTLPALVKHDATVRSVAYAEQPEATPARTTPVAWDEYPSVDLTGWRFLGETPFVDVPWLPVDSLKAQAVSMNLGVPMGICWGCLKNKGELGSPMSGLMVCVPCACSLGSGGMSFLLNERAKLVRAIDDACQGRVEGPRISLGHAGAPAPSPKMPRVGPSLTVRR